MSQRCQKITNATLLLKGFCRGNKTFLRCWWLYKVKGKQKMYVIQPEKERREGNMIPYNQTHFSIFSNVTVAPFITLGLQVDLPEKLVLNLLLKCIMGVWVQQGSQSFSVWWHRWQMQHCHQACQTSDGKSTYFSSFDSFRFSLLCFYFLVHPSFSNLFSLFSSHTPTFHISCIVSALLGCHTEQDEKLGKQLISCANWQEDSCVC